MKALRKWMSLEEHTEAARALWQAHALIAPVAAKIMATCGHTSRGGKVAERLVSTMRGDIDKILYEMMETWHAEGHWRQGEHLNPYQERREATLWQTPEN